MTPATAMHSSHTANEPRSAAAPAAVDRFSYDDSIARLFMGATILWSIVSMLVGVIVAVQLLIPGIGFGLSEITFGRLRPLHTNAAIFAFAGNALFTAIYYSTQRLCKTRMFSDLLGRIHFWGWQLIIVAAAITLPFGITSGKEYAELEWPIDIAIGAVWVIFGINFFGTLAVRRERHLYVAIWFYIATIVTVAVLHIFNSLAVPAALLKSYSVYAGVQDAFMQWWYGHNAVAFFLTTPFLGLMYYFVPKAAERPVFSYRLSIIHFWSLVFIYIWAGPHHLHYTALPEWASTLGMLFSVMLWMPSWGGMINGLLTLRGVWHKVAVDPILKFFVVGITFYGMSTFEGPLLSVKSVNALSHYTDWTIAHVHSGALGWVGFMSFGMIYWLIPRLFQAPIWRPGWVTTHFWIATLGMLIYIIAIYVGGLTQGLMWRALDAKGQLAYPDFVETVVRLFPFYWGRVLGGSLYLGGLLLMAINAIMTWRARPKTYNVPMIEAARLPRGYVDPPAPTSRLPRHGVIDFAHKLDVWQQGAWHRRWERLPLRFSVWVTIAVIVASLFEIIPTFLIRSNIPTIATVKPYTPLELHGREIYIANGCYNCHSQMIRPILAETKRYGDYSKPGEFVYDHPFQWGSRRIGPDLAREGGRQSSLWHLEHFRDPEAMTPNSIMPPYPALLRQKIPFDQIESRVRAMKLLGVPYDKEIGNAAELARAQAKKIADEIVTQSGPENQGYEDKQVVALIAYLQRMGTDLFAPPPAADGAAPPPAAAQSAGANAAAARSAP